MNSPLLNPGKSTEKRGDSTRMSLIYFGLELFGEHGFNATTTRMLCEQAGANISAIPYYFESKKGLYLAVMEYIVGRLQEHFGEARNSIAPLLEKKSIDKTEALTAIQLMIQTMAQLFVESDEPKAWVQLIMREQVKPTDAFDIIYNGQIKHIQKIFGVLIAACTGLDAESAEVKLRSHALIGQILVFILSRESILRNLGVNKFESDHVQMIYQILMVHADACLQVSSIDTSKNND
jgi:TetR/AcrR family transcriptional regulator, regulator of cefoperazone and chloramphenicol sensitivity